jgi:hypothetical protein
LAPFAASAITRSTFANGFGRRCGKHLRLKLRPKRRQLQRGTRVVTLANEREDRVELGEELGLGRRRVDSRLEVRRRERIDVGRTMPQSGAYFVRSSVDSVCSRRIEVRTLVRKYSESTRTPTDG